MRLFSTLAGDGAFFWLLKALASSLEILHRSQAPVPRTDLGLALVDAAAARHPGFSSRSCPNRL